MLGIAMVLLDSFVSDSLLIWKGFELDSQSLSRKRIWVVPQAMPGTSISDFETFVGGASYDITIDGNVYSEPWDVGNDNLALDLLNQAIAQNPSMKHRIQTDREFDFIRQDPRFQALIHGSS